MKNKTIDEKKFHKKLGKLLPYGSYGWDNDGQIIIYTGLRYTNKGNYKRMK